MKAITRTLPYLSLLKLRIVVLLVVVALVAALVAADGVFSAWRLAIVALAGGMASAGASVLNNYIDRDIDAVMFRTRNRALPRNRANPVIALVLGLGLLAVSLALSLRLGFLVFLTLFAGAFVYVVLYTMWLKRRSSSNIIVGGLSGSCMVLAGWFAVTSELSLAAVLIASIVFLWTPGHFWSFSLVHQESYERARIPMLPVVRGPAQTAAYITLHSALLTAAAVALYFFSPLGEVYLIGSSLLSALFLASSVWLWIRPGKALAWRTYKFSGLYLLGLFLFMAIDTLL
jgi:heme o synthase